MSNIDRATLVINETYADEYVKMHMTPLKVAQALADAGLLAPDPQIIRTEDEMRWEYGVEHLGHVSRWGSRESAEDDFSYYFRTGIFVPRLVRRLVGPAEPIAKETPND